MQEPPLDTARHAAAALHRLPRLPRGQWPRILGAAAGYGLISPWRARELLANTPQWWCAACSSSQAITCNWCGADACAECWRCVTPGCGEDTPTAPSPPAMPAWQAAEPRL